MASTLPVLLVNGFLVLFAVSLVTAAIPEPTQAQRGGGPTVERCSRCKNCKKCDRSKWGGKHCTHESGCCEERGGNCNPTKALLNTDPDDKRLIDINGEDVLTVRLAGSVFGTWACEDGSLVIAYMVGDEGPPKPVSDEEMARLKALFTFEEYLLNYQRVQAGGEAS